MNRYVMLFNDTDVKEIFLYTGGFVSSACYRVFIGNIKEISDEIKNNQLTNTFILSTFIE